MENIARMIIAIEELYGVECISTKKWSIGITGALMSSTVVYASVVRNNLLAHTGYFGGIFCIILIGYLIWLEFKLANDINTG